MLRFAKHAGHLADSATLRILSRAKRMKAAGEDVISFAAGEPDFDTPDHVKEAAIRAIRDGFTKYTPAAGIPDLLEAVVEKFRADGYEGLETEGVMVGVGTKGLLYTALQVLCEEGDEVVVAAPYWLSYPEMVRSTGARLVVVETTPADGYVIDPRRVEAALTPRTKAIVLNSPGNPTGTVQPDEVQRAIGRAAAKRGVMVVADEIYEHLAYAPARFASFARICPEARDVTLLVNGTSKAYSMTGWRIGYAAGPRDLVERMVCLQGHANSGPPGICQKAALAALAGPEEPVRRMRDAFDARRKVMVEALCSVPRISCPNPQGAFYALPDVSAFYGKRLDAQAVPDGLALAEILLDRAKVAVVPGDPFGAPYALRFSYTCSEQDIARGVARAAEALAALR